MEKRREEKPNQNFVVSGLKNLKQNYVYIPDEAVSDEQSKYNPN